MSGARLKHYGWGREDEGMTAEEQAFDEIVYMRVETGEMTARTCRDPAAKG